jgi:DNA-binding transcriptional regulator YhcF (GntR family)
MPRQPHRQARSRMTEAEPQSGRLTDQLIIDWANSPAIVNQVAASLARKILTGRILPYAELPSNETLADEWDTSERTVIRAKALLAEYGALRKELGIYWVA